MFAIKGQLKVALLVVVSLSTIGLVGNFYPLLVENADAHPHTVIQSTVVDIRTSVELIIIDSYSRRCGTIFPGIETTYVCNSTITGRKYTDMIMDYEVTTYYLDDGHEVYWEPGGSRALPETYRAGNVYYEIYGCKGSMCATMV